MSFKGTEFAHAALAFKTHGSYVWKKILKFPLLLQFGLAHRRITLRVLREHHRFSKSGDNLFPQFVLCVISVAPIDDLAGALAVDPYVF